MRHQSPLTWKWLTAMEKADFLIFGLTVAEVTTNTAGGSPAPGG